jgi:molybdopterin converting factor small subunit
MVAAVHAAACCHDQQKGPGQEPVMAKAFVNLPIGVALSGMPTLMECEGVTVAEALADCVAKEPRLKGRIFRNDGAPVVGISVNGRDVPPDAGPVTAIEDGDEIRLIPAARAC